MRISIILISLTLTGCAAIPNGVVEFCSEPDGSETRLDLENLQYSQVYKGAPEGVIKGDLENCSKSDTICIHGPFHLEIKKSEFQSLLSGQDEFEFQSPTKDELYIFRYKKGRGVVEFRTVLNYDGEFGAPPLIYRRCPFEFESFDFIAFEK